MIETGKYIHFKNILFVGCNYRLKNGGVSVLLNQYSTIIPNFSIITTTNFKNIILKFLNWIYALLKFIINAPKYKIIHVHSSSNMSFYRKAPFVLIGALYNKKVVIQIHSGDFTEFYQQKKRFVSYVLSKVDAIIVVSDVWKDKFQEFGHVNVFVLNNIIETPDKITKVKCEDKIRFCFISKMGKLKGVYDIIEAINMNQTHIRGKAYFILAGGGEKEKVDAKVNEYAISDIVTTMGWVNKKEKQGIYANSDIAIQPSHFESFGLVIAEALSYGLPVIATKTGGIVDIIQHKENGLLIEVGNIEQLTDAIHFFISNPDVIGAMSVKAAKSAEKYYGDTLIEQLGKIYSSI